MHTIGIEWNPMCLAHALSHNLDGRRGGEGVCVGEGFESWGEVGWAIIIIIIIIDSACIAPITCMKWIQKGGRGGQNKQRQ